MNANITTKDQQPSLPALLAALAAGAKSVNSLPSSGRKKHDIDDMAGNSSENDSDNEADDEFGYQMAFPEFNSLCLETRSALSSLLNESINASMGDGKKHESGNGDDDEGDTFEFDDPTLWDNAAETCESLLERVDVYIQNVKEGRAGLEIEHLHGLRQSGRNKAQGGYDRLLGSLVDITKPQITFGFTEEVQNSRTDPFCPTINQFSDCTLEIVPGHGLESRRYRGKFAKDLIAPKHHYLHPYRKVIENFEYRDEQLAIVESGEHGTSGTLNNQSLSTVKGIWIDTENELAKLVSRIEGISDVQEIAIDLEAHDYRSFSGFVCTMQISLRRPPVTGDNLASVQHDENIENGFDFIVDTLALRSVMNKYFAPIFADPNIVKVMHGADSDVSWLQRDFGIYIVNLFDTGRASRVLPHFSSAGLAYLLKKYANVDADKKHQLSDWRQRPIPDEMLQYATSDTMYLLDIYDKIKAEIDQFECDTISIKAVLDESRKVCLLRYDKEPFNPNGYKNLINSSRAKRKSVNLSQHQEEILKRIYDWRDEIAREEDESLHYVCPNSGLVRIASSTPENVTSLQACMNPLPPLVLKYSNEIIRIIHGCLHNKNFKPSPSITKKLINMEHFNVDRRADVDTRTLDSKKIFHHQHNLTSASQTSMISFDESLPSPSKKRKTNKIILDPSNKNFKSNLYSIHSIAMKPTDEMRGYSVDGSGAAKAVFKQMKDEDSKMEQNTVDIQTKFAHECAKRIRKTLMEKNANLLGLVKVAKFKDNDATEKSDEKSENIEKADIEATISSELPKSIKEVYSISNKREKRTKLASCMDNQKVVVPNDTQKEIESIHKSPSSITKKQKITPDEIADLNEQRDNKKANAKKNQKSDKMNETMTTPSFDYSELHLGNLQMFDPNAKMRENPFFEGVARSGGLSKHKENQRHKKRR